MASREIKRIDISAIPELLQIAEEVHNTGEARILRRDHEDIARITPVRPSAKRRLKGRPTSKDDPLWNIIGMAEDPTDEVTDVSISKHKYLAEAYLDKHL